MTLDHITKIVTDCTCETDVSRETCLATFCDSLDLLEIAMSVEDKFRIEIPDEEVLGWTTVADIENTVNALATPE